MRNRTNLLGTLGLAIVLVLSTVGTSLGQSTNTISSPSQFAVNGVPGNPTITLRAGTTNSLVIKTVSIHPVVIQTAPNKAIASRYSGATPQNVWNNVTIRVVIPRTGYPSVLYYVCNNHGFFGQINITNPPPPPRNTILSLSVGTSNVVMKSTGTNTAWMFVPEFSSNLITWAPVPSFSSSITNGTNTTTFNRLDPICGPNVYLRVNQKAP